MASWGSYLRGHELSKVRRHRLLPARYDGQARAWHYAAEVSGGQIGVSMPNAHHSATSSMRSSKTAITSSSSRRTFSSSSRFPAACDSRIKLCQQVAAGPLIR